MRKLFTASLVLCATLALALNAVALERVAAQKELVRDEIGNPGGWAAGTSTCTLLYSNFCTGYIYRWTFSVSNALFGQVATVADCCGPNATGVLDYTVHRARDCVPSGYGFTGSLAIHNVDGQDCPTGPAIASQPWLPCPTPVNFQTIAWGGVPLPSKFVYLVNWGGLNNSGYGGFDSDLGGDAAGVQPPSCPLCYPCGRTPNRSYVYGTTTSQYCPGTPVEPETTDTNNTTVEWRVYYLMTCHSVISVEQDSWGSVKNLYR